MNTTIPGRDISGDPHALPGGTHLQCASNSLLADCVACSDINVLKDATLRRIDEVINQDVEMQASCAHRV
jgi:hypothetical protein